MRILAATHYAAFWHRDQRRKYTFEPYVLHPIEVAQMVSTVTKDEDMIVASLLHDLLEDTKAPVADVEERFGPRVLKLVIELSEPYAAGNRRIRKHNEALRLSTISADAQTIKYADLILNSRSIIQHDKKFSKVYIAEKRKILTMMNKGDSKLYAEALAVVVGYKGV